MEGRSRYHIKEKYQDLFRPLVVANWQVWPMAQVSIAESSPRVSMLTTSQLINFRFMPLPYRVPFQSTCGVFWTLFLSISNSKYVQFALRFAGACKSNLISPRENEAEDHREGLRKTIQ